MAYRWPADTDFSLWELDVLDRNCPAWGRMMHICDRRYRRFHTFGRSSEVDLQAQSLSRSCLSRTRPDQKPRTRNHLGSPPDGDRLGRLLLDRTSALCAPLGDFLDPIRTPRRLRHQALGRCDRTVHPTLPGHARGASARQDQQDAFATGIAAEFPDVPHRYCDNHFLRDVAQPVLEADSHAKVPMRKKVRGLRTSEQAVLQRQKSESENDLPPETPDAAGTAPVAASNPSAAVIDPAAAVVLDYCAAVRGILNDDQGGPLHPPGLRMAEALGEVQESIPRNWDANKGGSRRSNSAGSRSASRRGGTKSKSSKK
jgi:hypothetical protein